LLAVTVMADYLGGMRLWAMAKAGVASVIRSPTCDGPKRSR